MIIKGFILTTSYSFMWFASYDCITISSNNYWHSGFFLFFSFACLISFSFSEYLIMKMQEGLLQHQIKSVFGSVVAGAFQINFHAKMHANNVFLFFKNYFWHQHIKTIQNVQTILNFSKKNSNFLGTRVEPRFQTLSKEVSQGTRVFSRAEACIISACLFLHFKFFWCI